MSTSVARRMTTLLTIGIGFILGFYVLDSMQKNRNFNEQGECKRLSGRTLVTTSSVLGPILTCVPISVLSKSTSLKP